MQTSAPVITKFICMLCFLVLISFGCRQTDESVQAPRVVVKKIVGSKPASSASAKLSNPQPVSGQPVHPATAKPDDSQQPVERAATSVQEIAKTEPPVTEYRYYPEGKTDPFSPLVGGLEPDDKQISKGEIKKRVPLTPLEKVDLSQLKLTGIIRSKDGNKALIEESSGKGYIITKGTFIGINSGKVTDILKDRVIVEEEVEDILGNWVVRTREMVLQKTPGEE